MFHRNFMKLFKGQLVVPFFVAVVNMLSPIVHGKEIQQADILVSLPVLLEVLYQNRQFAQLIKRHIAAKQYKQCQITASFFHVANITICKTLK